MTDTPQDERDVAAEAPSMAEEGNDEVRLPFLSSSNPYVPPTHMNLVVGGDQARLIGL